MIRDLLDTLDIWNTYRKLNKKGFIRREYPFSEIYKNVKELRKYEQER